MDMVYSYIRIKNDDSESTEPQLDTQCANDSTTTIDLEAARTTLLVLGTREEGGGERGVRACVGCVVCHDLRGAGVSGSRVVQQETKLQQKRGMGYDSDGTGRFHDCKRTCEV
jgi:hypothetical protein